MKKKKELLPSYESNENSVSKMGLYKMCRKAEKNDSFCSLRRLKTHPGDGLERGGALAVMFEQQLVVFRLRRGGY